MPRKKVVSLVFIWIIMLSGCSVFAGIRIMTHQTLPDITFTQSVTGFVSSQPVTATGIVRALDTFMQGHTSAGTRVGSGTTFTSAYQCEEEACHLNRVTLEFGIEPRIRLDGIRTPVSIVQFVALIDQDQLTATTGQLDGGVVIAECDFVQLLPTVEEAIAAAQAQIPADAQHSAYRMVVSSSFDGWVVAFYESGQESFFFTVDIPYTNVDAAQ